MDVFPIEEIYKVGFCGLKIFALIQLFVKGWAELKPLSAGWVMQ